MFLRFVQTCSAAPEQYDVYWGEELVGYLRMRWGHFRVECPDVGGESVLDTEEPLGFAEFEDGEREYWLGQARTAILDWLNRRNLEHEIIQC
jgi:hypothetical protein